MTVKTLLCDYADFNVWATRTARPRYQMIHHCINHSTCHRGQIITMGRTLGLTDPPATDYIRFIRTRNH